MHEVFMKFTFFTETDRIRGSFVSAVSELELKKLELLQIAVHLLLIIEVIKQPGCNKPSLNRACVDNRNANSKGKCYCPAHGQSRQYEYLGSIALSHKHRFSNILGLEQSVETAFLHIKVS